MTNLTRRDFLKLSAVGSAAAAVLAACGSEKEETAAARTDITIKVGPITDYDPFNCYAADQYTLMDAIYTTLVHIEIDENGEAVLKSVLADSWEEEENGTWVMHLNENATFSNGDPITAEDVKFSLETAAASPYQVTYCGMIQSVEVRDEHTAAVVIGAHNDTLPWAWDHTYIVSASAYSADSVTDPVCSGAYIIETLDEATGNITLKARSDYWGTKPAIETANIRVISDSDSAIIALEDGEVDLLYTYGSYASQLMENADIVVEEAPGNTYGGLYINCQVEPWSNVKLRQAVAYAVDYAAVGALLYDGLTGSDSTISYNSTVDPLPESVPEYYQDIEKAKQLVEESGLATPIDGGEIMGGSGGVSEMIQQYLSAIGINVTINEASGNDYVMAIVTHDFSLCVIPGAGAGITGSQVLNNSYVTNASSNYNLYSNAEVDDIAAVLPSITDKSEYTEKLAEAMTIIANEAPVISFGSTASFYGYVKGLKVTVCPNATIYIPGLFWEA